MFAVLVLLVLAGIIGSLVYEAWPAFQEFGPGFMWGTTWSPADDEYGAVIAIVGTLVTSAIALLIAVPISPLDAASHQIGVSARLVIAMEAPAQWPAASFCNRTADAAVA